MIGEILAGRYELVDRRGSGGMGVVYRARDTLLQRTVAVKMLSAAAIGTQGRAQLLREAQAAAMLNHPNIVSVHDVGETEAGSFIVMEWIEGRTLREQPPHALEEIISMTQQICSALAQAHAHGIVHRDLKPENILVTTDGAAKLTDFGLARPSATTDSIDGAIAGTVAYLAPEVALGQPFEPCADLYALGVMLYEWIVGRLPFAADDPMAIISQHVHVTPDPIRKHRSEVPSALEAVVGRLLAKRPQDRYASAEEVSRALTEAVTGKPPRPASSKSLPAQLTSFVGRTREMAEIHRLLAEGRLVTLTGAGGCGKTRLAVQVAGELQGEFPDGVWWADLSPLADPALVPQAVASAAGVEEVAGQPLLQTLSEALRSQKSLIVLDNCEHLVDACAALADALLRVSPQLRILATSRETLRLGGEAVFVVPSLSLPDPGTRTAVQSLSQYEAVQLFLDRAVSASPGFALAEANAPDVDQICRRLDGIPLALELAAARLKALPLETLAARLDDRFRLLSRGSRMALPRHQTLHALIDWSYDLLDEVERAVFRRLSVFQGGWTVDAAEAVGAGATDSGDGSLLPCIEVLDPLTHLVEKSLVLMEERAGETRYRMLESIREYADEKVRQAAEDEPTLRLHQEYYMAVAEAAEPELQGPGQVVWLQRLSLERDNLRAALGWTLKRGEGETALRLCNALAAFWMTRSHFTEGHQWFSQALALARMKGAPAAMSPDGRVIFAQALHHQGWLAIQQGDHAVAEALLEESLLLMRSLDNPRGCADVLFALGVIAEHRGDYSAAISQLEESLSLRRTLKDKRGSARALNSLGIVAFDGGDFTSARALLEESLRLKRDLGDVHEIAKGLNNLGEVARYEGDYAAARSLYEETLVLSRQLGEALGTGRALHNLALVAEKCGEHERARDLLQEALALYREMAAKELVSNALLDMGAVAIGMGEFDRALGLLREGLTMAYHQGSKPLAIQALEGIATAYALRADQGDQPECREAELSQATQLLGAMEALRQAMAHPIAPAEQDAHDRTIATLRRLVDEEEFDAQWARGRALTLEQVAASEMAEEAG